MLMTASAAAALLLPSVGRADTYHVSMSGADGADGSAASPWATLQHAADEIAAGDVVQVAAGNYAGFAISTTGTDAAPIRFEAASGVVIDAPNSQGEGITFSDVSYVSVAGFTIQDIDDIGIGAHDALATDPMVGNRIEGCTVRDVQVVGIYISQFSEAVIEGNEISGTRPENDFNGHGMYVANAGTDDTAIRGNYIHDNVTGIHFNGDISIGGDGIISRLTIEANVISDNDNNGLNMDGVQDSLVQNNLIFGNGRHGLRDYAIDAAEGSKGMVIINNTIAVPTGGGWCVRLTEDAGGGHVIFNNILINQGNEGAISVEAANLLQADHNLATPIFSVSSDESHIDLAAWRGLGHGAATEAAPSTGLFESPGTGNYHLLEDAAAVDQGVAQAFGRDAPGTDLDGNTRPVGDAVDQGAYEYCDPAECDPAPDAGTGPTPDAGTGPTPDAAGNPDAGPAGQDGEGGCGCRQSSRGAPSAWLLFAALLLATLRRRRVTSV